MFPTTVCNQTYTTVPLRVIPVASERRTVLRKQSFTIIDVPVGGDNSKAVAVRIDRIFLSTGRHIYMLKKCNGKSIWTRATSQYALYFRKCKVQVCIIYK
jgi:hypothetical protein